MISNDRPLTAGCAPPSPEGAYQAAMELANWLAAALDDDKVCSEYKAAINNWFNCAMPYPPESGIFRG